MSIRVNLPDGSVANFPAGMNPQQIQAEIERHMAQAAPQATPQRRVMTPGQEIARDVDRLRDTVGRGDGEFQENFDWQGEPEPPRQREIPLNAMEQQAQMEAQRRGPQRRNAQISIREAIEPEPQGYQQPTMGATELNQPAMRDAVRGREAPTSEVNTDRGPQRRRSEVSIREALPPNAAEDEFQENYDWQGDPNSRPAEQPAKDPATMTDAELEAAEIAARNPIGNAVYGAADTLRGGALGWASGVRRTVGRAASAVNMPGVGASLIESAGNLDQNLETARAEDAKMRAESDAQAQRFAEERARRQGQTAAPAAGAAPTTAPAPGQPGAGLPSIQNPNAGQRTNVAMPRQFSASAARPNAAPTFNMADGSTVKVGTAPPAAVKNAVRSGVDYMEQNADQVVFGLLRKGKIQQARDFQAFMAERKTIRGMEETNKSYVALHYKDESLWTESLVGMVDNLYPDGEFEIDTKGTRFMRDDADNVIGAVVSIRNKETGEVSEQEYVGMENVMRGTAEVGMPDAAFKYQQERVEQARAQKIENAKGFTTAYDAAAELLFPDGFVDGTTGKAFTPEERQQADTAIREYIASSRPDLPQPPPPQAPAPPPAASGVGSSIRSFFGGSTGDKPVPTFGG